MLSKYNGLLDAVKKPVDIDPKWKGTSDTVKAFAALLVELAKDATEQTERNLQLQSRIVRLTWWLLTLTVALLLVAIGQIVLFSPASQGDSSIVENVNPHHSRDQNLNESECRPADGCKAQRHAEPCSASAPVGCSR